MTAAAFMVKPRDVAAENGEVRIGRAFYSVDEAAAMLGAWREAGADRFLLCALRLAILNADVWWAPRPEIRNGELVS